MENLRNEDPGPLSTLVPNRQDWQVCEQMQLGLKSHRFGTGRYSPMEDIPYALDQEVLRALGHERPE